MTNFKPQVLHSGVDGLTVALAGNLPGKTLDKLDSAKICAGHEGGETVLTMGGVQFNVMEVGTSARQGYAFQFHTGEDGIKYQAKKSVDASQWNLRARASARFLAMNGLEKTHAQIYSDLRALGAVITDESVSAFDVCVDIRMDAAGTPRRKAFQLDPEAFIHHSRSRKERFYSPKDPQDDTPSVFGGRYIETVTIGSKASRQLQVYNKRREQIAKRRGDWFGIWGVDKDECPNVWRAELRFGREFLRDWNIVTIGDLKDCYGDLVKDSLQRIRYVEIGDDTNLSRAPNHPFWNIVVEAFSEMIVDAQAGIVRGRMTVIQREDAQAMIGGLIKGVAATLSVIMKIEDGDGAEFSETVAALIRKHITYDPDKWAQSRKRASNRYIFTRRIDESEGV